MINTQNLSTFESIFDSFVAVQKRQPWCATHHHVYTLEHVDTCTEYGEIEQHVCVYCGEIESTQTEGEVL